VPCERPGDSGDTGRVLVTFDLFSALIDSRTGGTAAFRSLAAERRWAVDPADLYDRWDAANKASQRDLCEWLPFAEHSRRALATAYAGLALDGDPDRDVAGLLDSVRDWPLWPDVAEQLPAMARRVRVGVLSNVDDAIFARTRVAPLVDDAAVLTSERLRAGKPHPEIYRRARERAGDDLVHVATSARDVRGALEAGIRVVRLRRPGHPLDPAGPVPDREAGTIAEVGAVLGLDRTGDADRTVRNPGDTTGGR
jgi:2-haloacid dehalogenase